MSFLNLSTIANLARGFLTKCQLFHTAMLRKAASVKRARSMALRGSGSDSDSDSDSFEAAMKRKSQKIANSVLNNEDLQYDIDTPATSEEKQDKQERGSRFLKDILKQKEIRDKERERAKIEWQRKNAKGMVFESDEYKQLAEDSNAAAPQLPVETRDTVYDIIKSKVTEEVLEKARQRYFERHPEDIKKR